MTMMPQNKSEKILSLFSFVLIAIAFFVLVSMGLILQTAANRAEILDNLENDRAYCENSITELINASDYLTTECWGYASDGDVQHMHNFWQEVEVDKTRDKAVQKLMHTNLTEEEKTHIMRAKAYSDGLIAGETWSMRMLSENYGIPEKDMPPRVREIVLNPYEQALPPAEKKIRAQAYLYGPEYSHNKSMIRQMVYAFNSDLSKRLEYETTSAMTDNKSANRYSVMVVMLLMVLMMISFFAYEKFMRRKNKELAFALEKAEAASSAKSYFTSRMSHEIRTPLNAVLGYLHIAEESGDPGVQAESLKKSRISAMNLLNIVNDVLDLSAIETGKMELVVEPYSVRRILQDMQVIYTALAAKKDVQFHIITENIDRDRLMGDRMRLNQILTNLMSNALKFTSGGGRIEMRACQEINGPWVYMTFIVTDTGIGMAPEFLPHIFDAYEQEDTSIHQRFGGSGLGMSIVKSLIDKMGGTISVQSEKGKGSTFTVTLKQKTAPAAEEKPVRTDEETMAAPDLSGLHILLAEDNAMNLEIAQAILGEAGVSIVPAANGKEAVQLFLQAPPGTFDLILMDIIMPEMDGYEATRQIRQSDHAEAKSIPIIAMSANAFASDVQKSIQAGMNDHVAKPIDIAVLFATLRRYVR